MKKGQIFTLDVMLAFVAIVAVVGLASTQLGEAYSNANNIQFQKVEALANDWANIGVKNILASVDGDGNKYPNIADTSNWDNFVTELGAALTNDFSAEAEITATSFSDSINGNCIGKSFTAVSRRIVSVSGNVRWLTVKVCYA